MTTVYLHTGMPKCASSALQSFLHRNDTLHRSEGLCYPVTCREYSGYFSHRPLHKLDPSQVPATVEKIATEAAAMNCSRILISSEEFVNSLWDRDITGHVIDALNARFGVENVRILMLFRNPFPFVESVYAQFLKGGMFRTPDEAFIKSKNNDILGLAMDFRTRHGFDFYSYSAFVERLRFHAPYNPFDMLSVEHADWDGLDILDVLCDRLKVSRGNPDISSNERYSETALHLLHHARRTYGFAKTKARREIIAALFSNQHRQFSRLVHVHGPLFDQILDSAERDRRYFARHTTEPNTHLFEVPEAYRQARSKEEELAVPSWQLRLVERIVTRDEMSMALARKMKANMYRKAQEDQSPGRPLVE